MKKMKYLAAYANYSNNDERINYPALITKANYICDVLNNSGYEVEIISTAWTTKKIGICKENMISINNNTNLHLFKSISIGESRIAKFIKSRYTIFKVKRYLLKNMQKKETLLVYHNCLYYDILKTLKKKKNINIILEVEELYDKISSSHASRKYEKKIIELGDKYIFVNSQLEKIINKNHMPYCVAHGTYKIEKQINNNYEDGKIHIVYSGIIDKYKKGAFTACALSNYLDENYVIHIIGFGSNNDIDDLKQLIANNNKKNKCVIIYDGLKKGKDYIKYIQKCHIGLSTQDPNGEYNNTSFPSKILAYLSNGLRVVTIDIPVIKASDVSNILYYYKENDASEIAKEIKKINIDDKYNSRKLIEELNKKFKKNLLEMLNE